MQMGASSQSFSALWHSHDKAEEKDLPKSRIEVLDSIIVKAQNEKAYGHLLKAMLKRVEAVTAITPDSLVPEVKRLTKNAEAVKGDPVLKAVYHTVLGALYEENSLLDENADSVSADYYSKALSDPDLLARTKAEGYEPLVKVKDDSKYFDNDLLSVVAFKAKRYQMLHQHYSKNNNRTAACLAAYYWLENQMNYDDSEKAIAERIQQVDSLLNIYGDLKVAGELALLKSSLMGSSSKVGAEEHLQFIDMAMKKWKDWPRIKQLTNTHNHLIQPSYMMNFGSLVLLPHQERKIELVDIRNLRSITMHIWRVNIDAYEDYNIQDEKIYAKVKKAIVKGSERQITREFAPKRDFELWNDSLTVPALDPGVYLLEVTTDNKEVDKPRQLFYVSDVFLLRQGLPENKTRYVVVSATTGQPLKKASIKWGVEDKKAEQKVVVRNCDNKGELVTAPVGDYMRKIQAFTQKDNFCPSQGYWNSFYSFRSAPHLSHYTNLYTDRAIYRPGQTVHVSLLSFTRTDGLETKAAANKRVTISLLDVNRKEVGSKEVVTDDFGKASAEFQLPESGLTGSFLLKAQEASVSFRVEEYKRPTFEVEMKKPEQTYRHGDTILVEGTARTFSGVPVQGAKVVYTVDRRKSWWWDYSSSDEEQLYNDTTITDDEGHFKVSMPMLLPKNVAEGYAKRPSYYNIVASVQVTDLGGETHEARLSLPVSNREKALYFSLPQKAEKNQLGKVIFHLCNVAGTPVDGDVNYFVDDDTKMYTAKANVEMEISEIPGFKVSGKHTIKAICEGDTIEQSMVVFSLDDKRPCIETHAWFYASGSSFNDDQTPVYVQVGSSDPDTRVYYNVFSGNRILEQGSFVLDNANKTTKWTYKEEYGTGVLITYAWVRDGVAYSYNHPIRRPLPDKRILLKWETFRNKLTPGEEEEWTLKATYPDGKPADAQFMATIYDQSLDQIASHNWWLSAHLEAGVPYTSWRCDHWNNFSLGGAQSFKWVGVPNLTFTEFDNRLFDLWMPRMYFAKSRGGGRRNLMSANMATVDMMRMEEKVFDVVEKMPAPLDAEASLQGSIAGLEVKEDLSNNDSDNADAPEDNIQVRENLDETAAFFTNAVTDENGIISLKFRLPESVTTWRVMGIATDRNICYGNLTDEAVAQKDLMVVPNMPRFVRLGDHANISARIFNATDKTIKGKAYLQLTDPDDESIVESQTVDFQIEAGKTGNATFSLTPKGQPRLLVCKVMAKTDDGASDGEQHYLPVLSNMELVTRTMPFTQNGPQLTAIDLQKLFPASASDGKLTIEYTNNPAWLMIQALPTMAPGDSDDAITQAMSYYANSLGQYISKLSPNIRQTIMKWRDEMGQESSLSSNLAKNAELKDLLLNETPWVSKADKEESQKRNLIKFFDEHTINFRLSSAVDKLRELQLSDGSWAWWKGMKGSRYVTTAVSEMLFRLNRMIGTQNNTDMMLKKAAGYLENCLKEDAEELRKLEKKGLKVSPYESSVAILYNFAIDNRKVSDNVKKDVDYLVNLFEKKNVELTIFGKARGAVILSYFGKKKKAEEYLKSIGEYAVVTKDMGRYFDTRKAYYSWCSYQIPTEVAAIEAYKMLLPEQEKAVEEMRIWLLQQKRAQMWNTPINSVDAIYAFLDGNLKSLDSGVNTRLAIDGVDLQTAQGTAGLGYVKTAMKADGLKKFEADKKSDGSSWGALSAQFMQKVNEVEISSSDISVKRELLAPNKTLKVGDKVTMRITIKAERNLDFVEVVDRRAACLEPVEQRSGYHGGYYIATKDYTTAYYFDHMAKGTHIVEADYYIDREGDYETGTCKVQCAYAPEFSATGKALKFEVKK